MGPDLNKVTVGYQDACLYPLWISRLGMRAATLFGAEAIWVPDHFMGFAPKWMWTPERFAAAKALPSMDAFLDPVAMLATTALRFRRPLLGTSVTEPIRRHPVSLAQSFVTLDHISRGRAVLGIGNGVRENNEPYGLPIDSRVARLEEALRIIRLMWESGGRPVDFDGRFWKLEDAVFGLPLYKGRAPRIFIGAHFPRMLELCGRYAEGWLPGQKVEAEEYASRLGTIRRAAERAGRSMDGFMPCQTVMSCMGRSREEVMEQAMASKFGAYMALGMPPEIWSELGLEHPLGPDQQGFLDLVPSRITPEHVEACQQRLVPELLDRIFYFGSPREIAAELEPLAAAGCRHFIIANMGGTFTGAGLSDLARMGSLMRRLRRL